MTQTSLLVSSEQHFPKQIYSEPLPSQVGIQIEQNIRAEQKWSERLSDFQLFCTLVESRSNIFVHGSNGCGKTTFVQDCIKSSTEDQPGSFIIYVDCVEYYSEKLISIKASNQLNQAVSQTINRLIVSKQNKSGTLQKSQARKLGFKLCKSFAGLLESLQGLQEAIVQARIASETKSVGPLDQFYFYLVLDNVKSLLKIEKQKKVLEKLAITQSLMQPSCFSIIVINDALVQEIQVFKEQTNVFDEYMFSSFFFRPTPADMLFRVMKRVLIERFIIDKPNDGYSNQLAELSVKYLEEVYDDFFNLLHTQLKNYTTSVNEYIYFFTFLYSEYMSPATQCFFQHKKKPDGVIDENKHKWKEAEDKIKRRGNFLVTKEFRSIFEQMLTNLYIHSTSKEEIKKEASLKIDLEFLKRVADSKQQHQPGEQASNQDSFNHREITYLRDYQKSINFTFMQALALMAAYIAGLNKESMDCKMFERDRNKVRTTKQKETTQQGSKKLVLLGKSKKFNIDRYVAIMDYLVLIAAGETNESKNYGHSLDYLATINSLAEEGLLKKSITKRSDSTLDDLSAIAFKCNFDQNFIFEVAKKINFPLSDYLDLEQKEE